MRETERTPYGARLYAARKKHARISQHALASAAGTSQSNIAGLEISAQGSSYTPQLAARLGVSASWLATGEGPMVESSSAEAGAAVTAIAHVAREAAAAEYGLGGALQTIARAIETADQATREDVLGMLTLFIKNPTSNAGLLPLIVSRLSGGDRNGTDQRTQKQA